MHPATLLDRPETPRFERTGALPSSPPPQPDPRSALFSSHRPPEPPRGLLPPGRDEMKPSISVIAAARRFFASTRPPTPPSVRGSASSEKRSWVPKPLPLPFSLLPWGSFTFFSSQSIPPTPLPPSCAKRRDVDSLLGSNFYGDASSNISGGPLARACV